MASEARATSFIAIARGEVPKDHWYNLNRALTNTFGYKALASWSGTMFEYFMPYQIMKSFKNTIWDLTYNSVIDAQVYYGREKNTPGEYQNQLFMSLIYLRIINIRPLEYLV